MAKWQMDWDKKLWVLKDVGAVVLLVSVFAQLQQLDCDMPPVSAVWV
jgi:hypothetical protein